MSQNPGTDLRTDWFADLRINTPAVERRAATLPARRSLKQDHQAAWLLNAVRCIDLTTLAGLGTQTGHAIGGIIARQP
ncbi:MAG: deoxyribose-phosphate aldolase, partial [Paracoccus sp. (in: a-proteobacteria)]|nr:deoxyribose-phosphate aldolase [Paracoccus sp. (in: a-proteobacteria)]